MLTDDENIDNEEIIAQVKHSLKAKQTSNKVAKLDEIDSSDEEVIYNH